MPHNPYLPLANIIETNAYPHARTLRTTLNQKFWDSFNELAGQAPILSRKPHVGLFDYCTLFIPTGFLFLLTWCLENAGKSYTANVLVIPVAIINIPLVITRLAFAAVAAILFSPITAIVHAFSRLFTKQSHNEALNLEGDTKEGTKQSLGQYLQKEKMDIEQLKITLKKKSAQEDSYQKPAATNQFLLMFWRKATGPSAGLICEGCMNGGCDDNHAPFSVEISKDENGNVKQAQNIHALFRLNVGDVVANIENEERNTIYDLSQAEKSEILAI